MRRVVVGAAALLMSASRAATVRPLPSLLLTRRYRGEQQQQHGEEASDETTTLTVAEAAHKAETAAAAAAEANATQGNEEGDEFDEVEAAAQELHDICFAMILFLRKADPDATPALYNARRTTRWCNPKPQTERRLVHGYEDAGLRPQNGFHSRAEFKAATAQYLQLGEKLLVLLDKPVLARLVQSAAKFNTDWRSDGVHKYKHLIAKASWRSFPHRWYMHAPFEVQQLRADVPQAAVQNTRHYRDRATLVYLFKLLEPQHAYRARIEKQLYDLITHL